MYPKLDLPDGLIEFATEFSRFKTPKERTQGWTEQPDERRGLGDVLDTIGTLMVWRYLVEAGVPATYLLTAGEGDVADIQVRTTALGLLNVNVKTSRWQPSHDNPCSGGHLAIKKVETVKGLADIYVQVFVHLEDPWEQPPHVHICGCVGQDKVARL